MKLTVYWIGLAVVFLMLAADSHSDESPHAYFDALVARPDHWKSYSLRNPAQLDYPSRGGYATASSGLLWVTYDPMNDPDPNRQDAAKVRIPAFVPMGQVAGGVTGTLTAGIGASDTTIPISNLTSTYQAPRDILIDDEILSVTSSVPSGSTTVTVKRGQYGTVARTHGAGAVVKVAQNSLANQVRLPLGTSDGHTYLFTWDAYWTDSYVSSGLTNHKCFQFGNNATRWMELQTRFDGGVLAPPEFRIGEHVAGTEIRAYLTLGGNVDWSLTNGHYAGPAITGLEPMRPNTGTFVIHPNRWTRFWLRVVQRPNDYDYIDYWVADEVTPPVRIYSNLPYSVYPDGRNPNSIDKFWLEFNTSTDRFSRGTQRDLVTYVRNFVALQDPPTDVSPLLLRPLAGDPLPPVGPRPTPPRNPRIIQ